MQDTPLSQTETSASYVNAGSLNNRYVAKQIRKEGFSEIVDSLRLEQTTEEVEKEHQILKALLEDNTFAPYPHQYSCGQGVCAIALTQISSNDIEQIFDKIKTSLPFKAATYYQYENNDGSFDIRIMAGASDKVASIQL